MPSTIPAPSVPLSQMGRAAHDIGMAGLLGGNLYGRFAMHPSVTEISDPRERGKLVNAAWKRYGVINGLGLAAVVTGWVGARANEAAPGRLSPRERRLARLRDVLVATTAATGTLTAINGMRFAKMEPGGAVPLADGDHTAPGATPKEAKAKKLVNRLGTLNLLSEAALVAANAALAQENFRRPPARRVRGLLPRR